MMGDYVEVMWDKLKPHKVGDEYVVMALSSLETKEYEVKSDKEGINCYCECPAFRWGKGSPCKHVRALMRWIQERGE